MIDDTLLEAEEKMDKAVEVAKEEFGNIRTGRANPGLFNKITVEYYGAPTPLQQLVSFQVPEARTIVLKPHDKSSLEVSSGPCVTPTSASTRATTARSSGSTFRC